MRLDEALDHLDLQRMVSPRLSVDEYVAHMGENRDIITLAFIVTGKQAAEDLSSWFERGYDWVLDAKVSDGEVESGKYLVFVELKRRTSAPERIVELLEDMQTLTDIKLTEWTVVVDNEETDANADTLSQMIVTSPLEYKKDVEREDEMNEWRELAGIERKRLYEIDKDIREFLTRGGL